MIYSWFTHKLWWFSIVMLVYQRVSFIFERCVLNQLTVFCCWNLNGCDTCFIVGFAQEWGIPLLLLFVREKHFLIRETDFDPNIFQTSPCLAHFILFLYPSIPSCKSAVGCKPQNKMPKCVPPPIFRFPRYFEHLVWDCYEGNQLYHFLINH